MAMVSFVSDARIETYRHRADRTGRVPSATRGVQWKLVRLHSN